MINFVFLLKKNKLLYFWFIKLKAFKNFTKITVENFKILLFLNFIACEKKLTIVKIKLTTFYYFKKVNKQHYDHEIKLN